MLRGTLIIVGMAAIPAGIKLARPVQVELPPPERIPMERPSDSTHLAWDSVNALLVSRDPFRPDRKPAPVPFSPTPVEPAYPEPAPPKPTLLLSGIVWGTDPSAVIEGLPGVEGGKLLRPGETANGVTLRRMTRDHVVLNGLDTTWVLSVRKPW